MPHCVAIVMIGITRLFSTEHALFEGWIVLRACNDRFRLITQSSEA